MQPGQNIDEIVEQSVYIEASQAVVFEYLRQPELMRKWMGVEHTLEARPGGEFRVRMEHDGKNIMRGEFVEVSPPDRIVWTMGWEGGEIVPPGSTRVEVDLITEGAGVRVQLKHFLLPDAERRKWHTEGWEHYWKRLALAASGGEPGPDPWAD